MRGSLLSVLARLGPISLYQDQAIPESDGTKQGSQTALCPASSQPPCVHNNSLINLDIFREL